MNDSKSILTSKTAWAFAILLVIGGLKALGLVDFKFETNEIEGIALAIVAIVGIVLRLATSKRIRIF